MCELTQSETMLAAGLFSRADGLCTMLKLKTTKTA
jgi:hypothetical protein